VQPLDAVVQLLDAVTWEAHELALSCRAKEGGGLGLAFSPDSKLLATAHWKPVVQKKGDFVVTSSDKGTWTVEFWDTKTGKPGREPLTLPLKALSDTHGFPRPLELAFSPDSKLLLTVAEGPQVWNLETGKPLWPEQPRVSDGMVWYMPHLYPLCSFRGDGKTFWTGLYQWDTASGRLLGGVDDQCTRLLTGLTSSGDGRRIAVLGNRPSRWRDDQGAIPASGQSMVGPTGEKLFETLLVWELPAAPSGDREDTRPLVGTPEQITLWLQIQTGRELWDDAPLPQGLPELGSFAVNNMRDDLWLQCREKLIAMGGFPVP
jgi:hypothetical protein